MKKIFILAGDPSGDSHAANLMKELKILNPDIEYIGIGGEAMIGAGLKSLVSLSEISVVGFWEVGRRFLFFQKLLKKCQQLLLEENISCFIPVDYPGFNIRLAGFAKKNGIPVIYYIAPQLWAWGINRAKKLADCVNKLLVVFPFEVEFFKKFGINTEFIGHPLLDNPMFADQMIDFDKRDNTIAFLPGSRKQEVIKHLPLFEKIGNIISSKMPDYKLCIAKSNAIDESFFYKIINKQGWKVSSDSLGLMQSSSAGIVKTGTSNLEAALCGMPFAMVYKTSGFSYHLSKYLINLPYISIINILTNKLVINEFIQSEANPENIADNIIKLLTDREYYNQIQNEFINIRKMLGESGASKRAAKIISNL